MKSCKLHQDKVTKLKENIESIDERYLMAKFRYDKRCQEKQDRLDVIAVMEAEEKKKKDQLDAEAGEKQMLVKISAARRAQLPKRVKDPMELWKKRRGEMELVNSQIPETQEDMFLPRYVPSLAPGTQLRHDNAPDQEIEMLHGPFPLLVDDFLDPYMLPDPAEVLGRHPYAAEGEL
jgi:protein-tyrosine-phosphatase